MLDNLTPEEKIFCQTLASVSLIGELNNKGFLKDDYYKKFQFSNNDEIFKKILSKCGLGNYAMIQIFLYALLVIPKELMTQIDKIQVRDWQNEINNLCEESCSKTNCCKMSTYKADSKSFNFYRHIRNAVSHSRCNYEKIDNQSYVTFKDEGNKDEHCSIRLLTSDVGIIMETLLRQLMEYLNKHLSEK